MAFTALLPLSATVQKEGGLLLPLLQKESDLLESGLKLNPNDMDQAVPSFLIEGRIFSVEYLPTGSAELFENLKPAFAKYPPDFLDHVGGNVAGDVPSLTEAYPSFVKVSVVAGQGDDHLERLRTLGLFLDVVSALSRVEEAGWVILPHLQEYHPVPYWQEIASVMLSEAQETLSQQLLYSLFVELKLFHILFSGETYTCYRSNGLSDFIGTEVELLPHPSGIAVKTDWFYEILPRFLQDGPLRLLQAGGIFVSDRTPIKAEMAASLAKKGEAVLRLHPQPQQA